jgi:hypothetical protein
MGFGSLRGNSLVAPSIGTSLTAAVLLANLPQLIISSLYLLYNGLFTAMLVSLEWSTFALKRQRLRVTVPVGQQRSTYWLQLPHIYAIPLIVAMALLHWLVAQSIFLASVVFYNDGKRVRDDGAILGCGFSCIAIIFAILLGAVMLFALLGNGCRRYDYRLEIPVASSCSAAISAACHLPRDDIGAEQKLVQWGALVERCYDIEESAHCVCEGKGAFAPKHYCLTSFDVI